MPEASPRHGTPVNRITSRIVRCRARARRVRGSRANGCGTGRARRPAPDRNCLRRLIFLGRHSTDRRGALLGMAGDRCRAVFLDRGCSGRRNPWRSGTGGRACRGPLLSDTGMGGSTVARARGPVGGSGPGDAERESLHALELGQSRDRIRSVARAAGARHVLAHSRTQQRLQAAVARVVRRPAERVDGGRECAASGTCSGRVTSLRSSPTPGPVIRTFRASFRPCVFGSTGDACLRQIGAATGRSVGVCSTRPARRSFHGSARGACAWIRPPA